MRFRATLVNAACSRTVEIESEHDAMAVLNARILELAENGEKIYGMIVRVGDAVAEARAAELGGAA